MKILRRDEIARKNRYRQHGRLVGFKTPERKVPGNAPGSVIGQRSSPYGVEAIVRRAAVSDGTALGRVSIEELFIFMVKGER